MNRSLLQHLFGFFLFCIPFSHPLLLWSYSAFDYGQLSVWSAFFLQFQHVILAVIAVVALWVFRKSVLQTFAFTRWEVGAFVALLLPIIWIQDPVLHMLVLLNMVFLLFVFKLFRRFKVQWDIAGNYFLSSMAFVSVLAVFQVLLQKNVGFAVLGEPEIAKNILGVAKVDLGSDLFVRAYGTFLHPNILAFFSVIAFFVAQKFGWKHVKWLFVIPLFLSFSRAAWIAFAVSLALGNQKFSKKDLIIGMFTLGVVGVFFLQPLLGRFTVDAAVTERFEGVWQSLKMLIHYPLGIGLQHYTLALQQVSTDLLHPWQVQPVHNTFLLLLNEFGIVVFGGVLCLLKKVWGVALSWQRQILVFTFVVALADHYLWTSANVQVFLFFFVCFIFYSSKGAKKS